MKHYFTATLIALSLFATAASAGDEKTYTITIKDHVFTPSKLEVPAGEKFKLIVENKDASPEEFESHSLKREKVVKGGSKIIVNLGPLDAGEYGFVGEFHEDTAKGTIIAK